MRTLLALELHALQELTELSLVENPRLCSLDIGQTSSVAICTELTDHAAQAGCDGGTSIQSGC